MSGTRRRIKTAAAGAAAAVTGTAVAATAAFALLVMICAFVAVAGPRENAGFRTRALQQTFAAASAPQRSVEATADWPTYVSTVFGPPVSGAVPPALSLGQLSEVGGELTSFIAANAVPLAGDTADWFSLTAGYSPVSGAAPAAMAGAGAPPRVEIICADPLDSHSRLLSGRMPNAASVAAGGDTTFEVAVTQATAARFGVHPGSRMALSGGSTLIVTGIIRPLDPSSAFWQEDPTAGKPFLRPGLSPYWQGAALAAPSEATVLQHTLGGPGMTLTWNFRLALGGVDADQAQPLETELTRVVTASLSGRAGSGAIPLAGISASSELIEPLGQFIGAQAAVEAVLWLLQTGVIVIGAVAALLGARLLAERRHGELALMRARGASLPQLAVLTLRDAAVVTLTATAVGVAAAVAATPGDPAAASWWLAGVIVLVSLAGPPLIVARRHRAVDLAGDRAVDRAARHRTSARRWVAEAAAVAGAAGGLIVLRQQVIPGSADVYPSAAPVLIAVPAAVLILRLYPLALRGLLRLRAPRAGAAGFVGLATAARASVVTVLPAFALVLALAVAAFGGMVRSAVSRGETAASWQATGADDRIDLSGSILGQSAAAQHAIAGAADARHATVALVADGLLPTGAGMSMAIVDPASYARLAAATPSPRFHPAALSRRTGPVPVLASPAAAAALAATADQVQLDTGLLTVRVAGIVASTPALPGESVFVVLPLWAVRAGPSNLMLIVGPRLGQQKLTAVVNRVAPGAVVTSRSDVLAALTRAPLQRGAYEAMAAGIAAVAALSVAVLLLGLALGARPRMLTLARLSTMGLGRTHGRLLVAIETVPPILAAAVGGALCAWILAPLISPELDLSAFTSSATPAPIRVDFAVLALAMAGLVVAGSATLATQIVLASRRGASRALRVDT